MVAAMISSIPKRLVASYILDWIVIIGFGFIGYGFDHLTPHYHNFSVLDLSISYPLRDDTVPVWLVGVVAGLVPAAIIFLFSWLVVPGPAASRGKNWRTLAKIKFWEWNSGWLGLALSLSMSLMITLGLKNFGKPRPNMLARCNPDLANIANYVVGGYGTDISSRWVMVDQRICRQTDAHVLNDGFQSWPSGHSTTAWAGLLYLTLYLCSKLAVVIPYLPSRAMESDERIGADDSLRHGTSMDTQRRPMLANQSATAFRGTSGATRHRDEAAAPPIYGLFVIVVPVGGALYICLSRYMDYAHHGFDILSGSIIGIISAWFSFRLYHLPIARGSGWAWGPRSRNRAFGIGVGTHGYVDESIFVKPKGSDDLEMGQMAQDGKQANGRSRWTSEGDDLTGPHTALNSSTYSQTAGVLPNTNNFSQPSYSRDGPYDSHAPASTLDAADTAYRPRVY